LSEKIEVLDCNSMNNVTITMTECREQQRQTQSEGQGLECLCSKHEALSSSARITTNQSINQWRRIEKYHLQNLNLI
jgi:hypothetical protein